MFERRLFYLLKWIARFEKASGIFLSYFEPPSFVILTEPVHIACA